MSEIFIDGQRVFFDEEDRLLIDSRPWRLETMNRRAGGFYVVGPSGRSGRRVLLHRLILDAPDGVLVDHKNGDGLDNRRDNLRLCTNRQNQQNRHTRGSHGYKGITWHQQAKRWQAAICIDGRRTYLGLFLTAEEAAARYDEVALAHFGEFANINGLAS